ncbi:hypothetical protein APSETT445_004265 [Aspergillus pseudonomiae]
MDRILAEKPYIKLDYLGVHPGNNGKGITTALVASGIKDVELICIRTSRWPQESSRKFGKYTAGFQKSKFQSYAF